MVNNRRAVDDCWADAMMHAASPCAQELRTSNCHYHIELRPGRQETRFRPFPATQADLPRVIVEAANNLALLLQRSSAMRNRHACSALLACLMAFLSSTPTRAQIHPHHAAQIRKAAEEVKARVAPKKPRTVLIWNTPPHLMDKDPHKGYCIPYGEEGMRVIASKPISRSPG